MAEASNSKSANDPQYYKNESTNYIAEIRQMMHGFGDCSEPLVESAKIIEDVVLHQMRGIVKKACEVAERRGVLKKSNVVTAEDFMFLLRKDKIKLQRLIKYLELKQFKASVNKVLKGDDPEDIVDNEQLQNSKPKDEIKLNRCIRAEMITRSMDEARYIKFSNARNASFANKNRHKFNDWICTDGTITISKEGYVILGYLAYETVAQIIDLVFLVRQDQTKIYGDAIDRLKLSYVNPYTYKPYYHGKGAATKPITPAEITEALRRFWSPQLDITGPFNRWSVRPPHLKFLSC
ncbi:transcription initiation protein SPT3 homolog isoform X2 [Vespula pensylvanica]|uniref:transcription initiation protein SPT3 homolog isoform X2 n=1 Tax=Vespula pensylvanica TaxID=30213 RepID=UPI001CBA10F3|nr:transcription initiation protein SPT3 homolog isoform X2 [Vespula pensylvanica]